MKRVSFKQYKSLRVKIDAVSLSYTQYCRVFNFYIAQFMANKVPLIGRDFCKKEDRLRQFSSNV